MSNVPPDDHVALFTADRSTIIEGRRFLPVIIPHQWINDEFVPTPNAAVAFDATTFYLRLTPDERALIADNAPRTRLLLTIYKTTSQGGSPDVIDLAVNIFRSAHDLAPWDEDYQIAVDAAIDAFHGSDREYTDYLARISPILPTLPSHELLADYRDAADAALAATIGHRGSDYNIDTNAPVYVCHDEPTDRGAFVTVDLWVPQTAIRSEPPTNS